MPVEPFVALLDRWRRADGMFARGRVLTEAARLLRNLTPDERRTLGRALAERGAPELAEQLDGSFGGSMEAEQVRALADQLLSMDDDELGALVDGLRDPDQRRQLATEAVDRAFAVDDGGGVLGPGEPTGPPPGAVADGPPPPPGAPATAAADPGHELDAAVADARRTLEAQQARLQELADTDDLDVEDLTLGSQELGSTEVGAVGLGGVALGSADLVDADLVDVELGPGSRPDAEDPEPGAGTDGPDGSRASADPVTLNDDPSPSVAPRSTIAPAVVGTGAEAGRGRTTASQDAREPAEQRRPALLARLDATDQALARLQLLRDDDLDDLDATTALQVLDAFPDGWQRRRAGLRLVAAGVLHDVAAEDLVHRFARTGDATFVVGGLIDAGHLDADALVGLLPTATVTRLRRRQED